MTIYFGTKVAIRWPIPVMFTNIYELDCGEMGRCNLLTDIFRNWRHLLDLSLLFGWMPGGKRYFDMDFCGIHPGRGEDTKATKDSVYLANVHIVPFRPCLVKMLSK